MFTEEQLQAIHTTGSNIIVSAGAGSGKTKVLTERVITKIKNGIDINRLLVLTFTKEAAFEMKDRIRKRLVKENLTDQIDYIDSAYITTFDSFALSIVRKYHYLLGITKNVSIIDSSVIEIQKYKLIDEIFESHYGEEKFNSFISSFSSKDDSTLKRLVIKLSNKMDLIIDKDIFLNTYIDNYYDIDNLNNLKNEYIKNVFKIRNNLSLCVNELCNNTPEKYAVELESLFSYLLTTSSYDELSSIAHGIAIPRMPNGSSEEAKSARDELKNNLELLKKLCELKTENEIVEYILSTKGNASVIIDLVKELDKEIHDFKQENDKYEFNDIAYFAIKVVRENESVRNELRDFYAEIMIDEYQDTNDIQETFINLIENNNVYVVGDIKQSIYRFRNANPNIFREKYLNYQDGKGGVKIDLLKNFRSRKETIDTINKLFNRVMDLTYGDADYEVSHQMVFGNTNYQDNEFNNDLEILTYTKTPKFKNEEYEAFIVARDIKQKLERKYRVLDKETNQYRLATYKDFCIIIDRTTTFNTYKKIFEYLKLPLNLYKDETLTDNEDLLIIKNIINAVICIHNNDYSTNFKYYLTSILRSFIFSKKDDYIFDMFLNNNFKENEAFIILKTISENIDSISVYDVLKMVIDKFNIYEKLILKGDINSSIIRYDNILSLASNLSQTGYTIYDFSEYLESMLENSIEIKYSLDTKSSEGIKIMNIHKSKGLEFSVCYFCGFSKTFNKDDLKEMFIYDNTYGLIMPSSEYSLDSLNPLKELYKIKYNQEDISERIRLFYVALTRARDKIVIVMPTKEDEEMIDTSNGVEDKLRSKYNSFLDIMNSVLRTFNDNIIEIKEEDISITKDYDLSKKEDSLLIETQDDKIKPLENDIEYKEYTENRFSKSTYELIDENTKKSMEYGTYVHSVLEMDDLKNPVSKEGKELKELLPDLSEANIYKEYEFIYKDNNELKHGIIDLMIEYSDNIQIIDYKLSNIDDENYLKQLNGYKKYIESITDKPVIIYLYSINKKELRKL